ALLLLSLILIFLIVPPPPSSTLFPYTTLFRSIALAEKHDRAGILTALKKRHCYGATDHLIVNVRSGEHLMGDEFKTVIPPSLERSEEHTSELQSRGHLVCRLLLEKKNDNRSLF